MGAEKPFVALLVISLLACFPVGPFSGLPALAEAPEPAEEAAKSENEPSPVDELALEQSRVADKYTRLEQLIIRMSEIEAISNPERAALLKRAAQQSAERLTRKQLNTLIQLLTPPAQLKRAVDEQQQVVGDLKALLELLMSENRSSRLKDEEARIREYIKEVERIIRLQRGLQGRTEGGGEYRKLAQDQEGVADRTGELAKRIEETEEADTRPADRNGSRQGQAEGKPDGQQEAKPVGEQEGKQEGKEEGEKTQNGQKGEAKPQQGGEQGKDHPQDQDDKQSENDGQSQGSRGQGEKQQEQHGQPQQPQDGGEGQQSDGDQQQQPRQEEETPGRKRIQAAEQRMRQAQRKLEEAKRADAVQEQEQARQELEKAKAELEQILRQLREEEVERMLAMLEGRFRRMLETQLRIYESTKRLDKIPPEQRGRQVEIQAGKLSFDETKLVVETDKALTLLTEEGSSVAFPETVKQMRDEMQNVADHLAAAKVGLITQTAEEEIIAALEELIAALQKAQQDLEQQRQQQRPMPVQQQERPLVDQLAELKMIRALQMRVNTRTLRYARLLQDMEDPVGQAEDEELREALIKLGEREERLHQVTRDIVLGKNR